MSTEHMATHGWTIGSVTADDVQWSVVATGARRVLRYLWTHPRSFELRNADGIVDAAVFVHDQRRVWLRPGLEETARAALTRAAMAMLVAGPLTADADDLNQ
jgi:hypothetical protein